MKNTGSITDKTEVPRCIHRHSPETHPNCFRDNNIESGIVIPDPHFPIHDKGAYELVMRFAEEFKPDIQVNLGDLGHFEGISHWNKQRYKLRKNYPIRVDLDMCLEHHKHQRRISPKGTIYTLGGNHDEEWIERWIEDHPEMEGYFDYKRDMGINEFNIEHIPIAKQPFRVGKLRFIHGWYVNKHHSKKHAENIHHCLCYAHAHDMQSFTPENIESDKRYMTWCIGHLSDEKKADYLKRRPTNWMLGFAIFWMDTKTGNFTLLPIPLPNRQFIFNGKMYKA